jgi:uncharacterized membrane protein
MTLLGTLPGAYQSNGWATSADGSTIVGSSAFSGPGGVNSVAIIWDSIHGMRDLQAELTTDFGLDLTGWSLQVATEVSADGFVIAGWVSIRKGGSRRCEQFCPNPHRSRCSSSADLPPASADIGHGR